jgi:hypothetical protein
VQSGVGISASGVGITAGREMLSAARVPPPPLVARRHVDMPVSTQAAWPATLTAPAGIGNGGTPLPASAQAARATCRLAKGAATQRWSFLPNFFRRGLF